METAMLKYNKISVLLVFWILISNTFAETGVCFRMQSDRLWYNEKNEEFDSFLARFTQIGIAVERDPSIKMKINGDYRGQNLETCLDEMLYPLSYVLTWDVLKGPVGGLLRLNSMKIFKQGEEFAVLPLKENPNLQLSQYDGKTFVADEILIGFKAGTSAVDVSILLNQIGGTITESIKEMGIYRIRLTPGTNIPALVEQLKNNPVTFRVEPNYVTPRPRLTPLPGNNLKAIYNPVIPDGEAYLAVLDSGLKMENVPGNIIAGTYDALHPGEEITDTVGHGTQMAMIASGLISPNGITGSDGGGSPLVAIRTFDANGNTSNYDIMRGIQYALDSGARVINLSWGSDTQSDFISRAIYHAHSEGAIVAAAAGNLPTGKKIYPAAYPTVLAIAATKSDGTLWEKSNYGKFVFAAAPGTATLPKGDGSTSGNYAGTSISSAYVAGIIARYISENPGSTQTEIVTRLGNSLSPHDKSTTLSAGKGVLDFAAVARFLGK